VLQRKPHFTDVFNGVFKGVFAAYHNLMTLLVRIQLVKNELHMIELCFVCSLYCICLIICFITALLSSKGF